MFKRKDDCDNCEYEQDIYCTSPIGRCIKEAKREKIHDTINDILVIIAMILSVAVLLLKIF